MANLTLVYTRTETARIPLTDTQIIAQALDYRHENVIKLTRRYQADLEEFGPVGFEIRDGQKLQQGGFAQTRQVALLTEQQATLLICYMRNSPKVRAFKLALVKAFYEMRVEIQRRIARDTMQGKLRAQYNQGYADALQEQQAALDDRYLQGWEAAQKMQLKKLQDALDGMHDYVLVDAQYINDLKAGYEHNEKLRPIVVEFLNMLQKILGTSSVTNVYMSAIYQLLNGCSADRQLILKRSNKKLKAEDLLIAGKPA